MDDKEELFKQFGRLFDMLAEPLREELLELHTKVSVQRYLLEVLYANQFLDDAEGFRDFMARASDHTKQKPSRSGPVSAEDAQEQLVRMTVHMDRFRDAVLLRLAQGIQD